MTAQEQNIIESRVQFGILIRDKRKKLNLSQTDLSKALDMRQALISEIESGSKNYTIDQLLRICDYLGVKITLKNK